MKKYLLIVMAMICLTINAQEETKPEQKWKSGRPDGHAPISVMGDHMHTKGEWMFSYRYMNMKMKGLLQEDNSISLTEGHNAGYIVTPENMDMNMHMLGMMYAPSDKLTLMLMANVIENEMDLQMRNMNSGMIMPFSTSSRGFGDMKISGLYKLMNKKRQTLHAELGMSIPTGNINKKDSTPMSSGVKVILPYPMQIGSGTVDANVGLTYLGQNDVLSWGNQLRGIIRVGENKNDYRMGNQYQLNNWIAFKTTDWLSLSARIEGKVAGDISGINSDLNPTMVTTADTENSGGSYINSAFGFNTYIPNGKLKNIRLGFEFAFPIYQKVNGIQLEQKETLTFGLQYSL